MADQSQSKIPRYEALNSKIPVLSKTYKRELRDVKSNKEIIERKTAEIEVLKRNLDEINTRAICSKTTTEITEKTNRCV